MPRPTRALLSGLVMAAALGACARDQLVGPTDQGPLEPPRIQAAVGSIPCPPTIPATFTLATCFEFTTIPGVLHGFIMGSSLPPSAPGEPGVLSAEYLLLSPTGLSPVATGQAPDVNRDMYTFQPEFNGTVWNDVLRIVTAANEPAQAVTIAVARRTPAPIESQPCPPGVPPGYALVFCFEYSSTPGVLHGFVVGASIPPATAGENGRLSGDYVLLSPSGLSLLPAGETVDLYQANYLFQSEFNGVTWNDVLRFNTPADRPAQTMNLAVAKRPLSPALQVGSIVASLAALQTSGVLSAPQATLLTRTLTGATNAIEAGRTPAAIALLRVFVLEVRILMRPRNPTLTPEQGAALIEATQAVIARLRP